MGRPAVTAMCIHSLILPLLEQEKHTTTFLSLLCHISARSASHHAAALLLQAPQAPLRGSSSCALRHRQAGALFESPASMRPKCQAIMLPNYIPHCGASTMAAHLPLPPAQMPPP
jgi:hypothetical protein